MKFHTFFRATKLVCIRISEIVVSDNIKEGGWKSGWGKSIEEIVPETAEVLFSLEIVSFSCRGTAT